MPKRRPPEPELIYTVELDAKAFAWLRDLVRVKAERYGEVLAQYGPMAVKASAAFEAAAGQHETPAEEPVRKIKRRESAAAPEPQRKGTIKRRPR